MWKYSGLSFENQVKPYQNFKSQNETLIRSKPETMLTRNLNQTTTTITRTNKHQSGNIGLPVPMQRFGVSSISKSCISRSFITLEILHYCKVQNIVTGYQILIQICVYTQRRSNQK